MRNIYYQYSKNIVADSEKFKVTINNSFPHLRYELEEGLDIIEKTQHWTLNGLPRSKSSRFNRPEDIFKHSHPTLMFSLRQRSIGKQVNIQNISIAGHGLRRNFFGLDFK